MEKPVPNTEVVNKRILVVLRGRWLRRHLAGAKTKEKKTHKILKKQNKKRIKKRSTCNNWKSKLTYRKAQAARGSRTCSCETACRTAACSSCPPPTRCPRLARGRPRRPTLAAAGSNLAGRKIDDQIPGSIKRYRKYCGPTKCDLT